jgi:predicted nuclease of predicted toxin-antitoxin system
VSTIRLYTDEHVAQAVIRGLRQRGIDVLSVPEADMRGARDEEHLALAYRQGRVVFTQDADFLRLAAAGNNHAGIVYASQQTSIGEIIRGLVLIHQVLAAEEMSGRIEYL